MRFFGLCRVGLPFSYTELEAVGKVDIVCSIDPSMKFGTQCRRQCQDINLINCQLYESVRIDLGQNVLGLTSSEKTGGF